MLTSDGFSGTLMSTMARVMREEGMDAKDIYPKKLNGVDFAVIERENGDEDPVEIEGLDWRDTLKAIYERTSGYGTTEKKEV